MSMTGGIGCSLRAPKVSLSSEISERGREDEHRRTLSRSTAALFVLYVFQGKA